MHHAFSLDPFTGLGAPAPSGGCGRATVGVELRYGLSCVQGARSELDPGCSLAGLSSRHTWLPDVDRAWKSESIDDAPERGGLNGIRDAEFGGGVSPRGSAPVCFFHDISLAHNNPVVNSVVLSDGLARQDIVPLAFSWRRASYRSSSIPPSSSVVTPIFGMPNTTVHSSGFIQPSGTGIPMPSASGFKGLHALAQANGGRFIGSAMGDPSFDDKKFLDVLSNKADFGVVVAESSMKVCREHISLFRYNSPQRLTT